MPGLDDQLIKELDRVAEPRAAEPDVFLEISRRRDRRQQATRVRRGALVVLVVTVTVAGFLAVRTIVGDRSVPAGPSSTDAPAIATPSAKAVGTEVGLDFRLCSMDLLGGVQFGPSDVGLVQLGTRVVDGRCPALGRAVLVADFRADGIADTWSRVNCRGGCAPSLSGATDLNGDRWDEVFVTLQPSSTPAHKVYTITDAGEMRAVTIGPVGHPEGGFDAGDQAVFTTGGDEGFSGAVWCTGYPDDTVIDVAWSYHPVETGDATKDLHRSRFSLDDEGVLQLADSSDTAVPIASELPGKDRDGSCGIELDWP